MDIAGHRTLYTCLRDHAARKPEAPWLAFEDEDGGIRRWSFAEGMGAVHQAARFLQAHGIGPGHVVNLHLANHPAYPQLILAASYLGATVLPSAPNASADEITYLLDHSEARLVITTAELAPTIARLPAPAPRVVLTTADYEAEVARQATTAPLAAPAASHVVQLLYTSGTTSRPKGVMLTDTALIYGAEVFRGATGLREDDHHLISLPLYHAAAQCHALWPSLVTGCRATITARFSGRRFFSQAVRHDCTMAALFGAPLRILLSQPADPDQTRHRLRNVTFAQNLTHVQYDEWHRRFRAPLQQLWGMTETTGLPLMSPLTGDRRLAAMGRPVVGYEVKIVDDAGREVGFDEPGQLIVRGTPGRTIMAGYLKNPEATARTLQHHADGTWLHSGDTVRCDADGFVYFVDRGKDLIKRGGENISSSEIEGVIALLPAVADVAVIGLPDPIKDEAVAAVIVVKPGQTLAAEAVQSHCAAHLSAFKIPEHVRFVETLPRTSVGKIQKAVIRTWFA